jgi:hypothetical protein
MKALVSDALILAGAGTLGWFAWEVWPPAVLLWGGLVTMAYGIKLGVADAANTRDQQQSS